MLFLQRNFCYSFKDEILIYLFFEFTVIFLILYEAVSLGICI